MAKDQEGGDRANVVDRWYATSFEVGQGGLQFTVECGNESDGATLYLHVITDPPRAQELFRELGVALLRYANRFDLDVV